MTVTSTGVSPTSPTGHPAAVAVSERFVRASPERVFARLVDAERYPEWLVGARKVEVNDPAWPAPGSSFEHEVGGGPIQVHDSTSVSGIIPGRSLTLVVRARPLLIADVRFELFDEDGGTRLRMRETERGAFRLLAPVFSPFVKLRNDRSLQRLARLVEA